MSKAKKEKKVIKTQSVVRGSKELIYGITNPFWEFLVANPKTKIKTDK